MLAPWSPGWSRSALLVVALVLAGVDRARSARAGTAARGRRRRTGRRSGGCRVRSPSREPTGSRRPGRTIASDHDLLIESLAQGVLSVDPGLRIVAANGAAHALLARAARHADRPDPDRGLPRRPGRGDRRAPRSTRDRPPARSRRPSPTARASSSGPGAPPSGGVWLVLEDVSELRRLQQIRTEFIDNLSHELRTPLTTVSLLAETLTREADAAGDAIPPKMRDRIGKIEVETGHLVQMVSELLDLSRIESGGTIQAVDLVDLGQVATESAERLRLFADRQGVALRVDAAGPLPPVRGDAARLGQVFVNLLHNAVKFSPDGGDVSGQRRRRGRPGRQRRGRSRRRASRGRRRPGSSSASTRWTGRGSGARPAEPGWASRSRATSSSSTVGRSGSNRSRDAGPPSGSPLPIADTPT